MTTEITVFLVDNGGREDADNVQCSPCIKCILTLDLNGAGNTGELTALLDSGAYPIAVDRSILSRMGSASTGSDSFFSPSGQGTTEVHDVWMWLKGVEPARVSVLATDHRRSGLPYDIILGRVFLTQFDFGFDREKQAWKLSLPTLGTTHATN